VKDHFGPQYLSSRRNGPVTAPTGKPAGVFQGVNDPPRLPAHAPCPLDHLVLAVNDLLNDGRTTKSVIWPMRSFAVVDPYLWPQTQAGQQRVSDRWAADANPQLPRQRLRCSVFRSPRDRDYVRSNPACRLDLPTLKRVGYTQLDAQLKRPVAYEI